MEVFAMADILVRDLDPKVVKRLKEKAKSSGRSLQGEVKAALEQAAATLSMDEARQMAEGVRARFKGRQFSDSTALIREDRDR
jgi:antitoxin FitA